MSESNPHRTTPAIFTARRTRGSATGSRHAGFQTSDAERTKFAAETVSEPQEQIMITDDDTQLRSMCELRNARHEAIALRAFALYELNGRQHGIDQSQWLQAEQELIGANTVIEVQQDNLVLTVRVPLPTNAGSKLLASISPHSILLLLAPDDPTGSSRSALFDDLLRVISLPTEIDPEQVTAFVHGDELTLRLSVSAAIPTFVESA